VRAARIYAEELRARAGELVMLFRGSMIRDLDAAECVEGAALAWSMWPGYLRDDSGIALQAWAHERRISRITTPPAMRSSRTCDDSSTR
jgi:ribonuclease J